MAPKSVNEIRAAFLTVHGAAKGQREYMSVPADPERDADLIVMAALDELEQLRGAPLRPPVPALWWVWSDRFEEDGWFVYEAATEAEAKEKYRAVMGEHAEDDEPLTLDEIDAKPITAKDVNDLRPDEDDPRQRVDSLQRLLRRIAGMARDGAGD